MKTDVVSYIKVVPWEKFVYRINGRWAIESPLTEKGIVDFIVAENRDVGSYESVKGIIKAGIYPRAAGVDMLPGKPPLCRDSDGQLYVNTWHPPDRTPHPGRPYDRLTKVLRWLVGNDEQGLRWLTHWMAAKVQNPELVPKTAVLFAGPPGSGKNTFSCIMQEMLGRKNCTEISRRNLESRFNARWGDKLFVFADEITTNENKKDVSQDMKRLITGYEVEMEGKGKDQICRKNRMALALGSNDDVTPVWVELGDRRYTVFTNHDHLTDEYMKEVASCFHKNTPTEDFLQEIEGFWADLLALHIDYAFLARPFDNDDRRSLISASSPPHRTFFQAVDARGIDEVLRDIGSKVFLSADPAKLGEWWPKGVVHETYRAYCEHLGGKALGRVRFATAVRNHRPSWETSADGLRWRVKRSAEKAEAANNVVPIKAG